MQDYLNALEFAQKRSIEVGNLKNPWSRRKYEKSRKNFEIQK